VPQKKKEQAGKRGKTPGWLNGYYTLKDFVILKLTLILSGV